MQAARVKEGRDDAPRCAHRVHLTSAGASLMPRPVTDVTCGHLALNRRSAAMKRFILTLRDVMRTA
jgi:hypothetical protein